jgi:TetR/AcrR family tetracycline transcriptional repressor
MALDRTRVVRVAIELLDEVGLDGLSLRRLAAKLGVQAPALYWHFKNKQELLDQMAAAVTAESAALSPPSSRVRWDDWLAAYARSMRSAFHRHRDGVLLAASTQPPSSQWREVELLLKVLGAAGVSTADGMRAMIAIRNYVSGFALEEQSRLRYASESAASGPLTHAQYEEALARLSGFPRVADAMQEVGDPRSDSAFEDGLQTILDGVRARAC